MTGLLAFLAELRRRRVYHVAVVYAAGAFVAAQAAEIFLPRLGLPDWSVTAVVILAVAGLPVALILGWVFDITPGGLQRSGAAPGEPVPMAPGRWRVTGGAAAAVVVLLGGGWWLSSLAFGPSSAGIERLAVLPLANLMNDPDQEYFVQGMHDALISELSHAGIGVIARTSVMRYQQTEKPVREIARELDVGGVIEGSVFREANQVRIHVRLIEAGTEAHLWSRTYDAELQDVLALHRRVTREVAGEIRASLTPGTDARLAGARRVDPDAYEAWLRGRFHADRWTFRDQDIALRYFELALAADPRHAPAHAGIALIWHQRRQFGLVPPGEATPRVHAALRRALELDGDLAEAHLVLAMNATWSDWDWESAARAFRRALEIDPNNAEVRAPYSHFLFTVGREEEAMAQIERALELDPFNPFIQAVYGIDLIFLRRYADAIAQLQRTLANDPDHGLALHHLERAFELNGMPDAAFERLKRNLVLEGRHELLGVVDSVYADAGYRGVLRRMADIGAEYALARGPECCSVGWGVARLYAKVGESDQAFEWLEKAFEARDPNLPYIAVDPDFDSLRAEARFHELLRRMDLVG